MKSSGNDNKVQRVNDKELSRTKRELFEEVVEEEEVERVASKGDEKRRKRRSKAR